MICSFCGETEYDVAYLIAGPGVNICDECVKLCNAIIIDHIEDRMCRHNAGDLDRLEMITTQGWFET